MGRQSSRMYYNENDHKDVYYNGSYHNAMYLTDADANAELIWQKLQDDDYFSVRVIDYMVNYETGDMPSGGQRGYVAFTMGKINQNSYTIDWGDGTVTTNVNNHTYPTGNGTNYTVKIYGEAFRFQAPVAYQGVACSCVTEILTPIKRGMSVTNFDLENGIPSYNGMFEYSVLLREVPQDLFINVNDYESLSCGGMFARCGISSVPTGLFDGVRNWAIDSFYYGCKNIMAVPYGAFSGGTFAPLSTKVFEQCGGLRFLYDYPGGSAPSFAGTIIEVVDCFFRDLESVNGMFNGISTLKTITNKLFRYSPNIISTAYCFNNCTNLMAIPEGLFDGLELLEDARYCFCGCTSVNEVPNDLFHDCFVANNFMACFSGSGIEEIPSDLFASINGSQINFASAFQNTPITSIPLGLFDGCKENSNFQSTFSGCEGVVSSVPDLWNYTDNGSACYSACTNASNYDEIPDRWK